MPQVNAAGVALIKHYESCRLVAYLDDADPPVWTIGWGHTGNDVYKGLLWTQEQADAAFERDLARFAQGVAGLVELNITPNQFAALVSLAYNIGINAFAGSTLLRFVNAGRFEEAAIQFGVWVHAGTEEPVPGLVARRKAERALFLS